MKLTFERDAALAALGKVVGVVERRNTIPILSNVLVRARQGSVTLTATDLDIETSVTADAEVSTPGATTLPAELLADLFRSFPLGSQAELTLNAKDDPRAQLRCGRSRFRLPVLPEVDFPVFPDPAAEWGGAIEVATLRGLLDRTVWACSKEGARYYLQGCFLHEMGGRLIAVATDGHRLARVCAPWPEAWGAAGPGVIVPAKAVRAISKLLDGVTAPELRLGRTGFALQAGPATLKGKLIDGSFPDYVRVIPRANDKVAIFDKGLLGSAAKRVALVSQEKSRSLKFALTEGSAELTVRNMESGIGEETLEADYGGAPIEIGFNARYLAEALDHVGAETVEMRLSTPSDPALLLDPNDLDARFVVMPLRV